MRSGEKRLLYADSVFFESGTHLLGEPPLIDLPGIVPDGWSIERHGWWTHASPAGHRLPQTGWKIHVSADPRYTVAEMVTAATALVALGTPFKVLSSARVERRSRAKFAAPTQVGKTLTAYPSDAAGLLRVLHELYDALPGRGGPAIMGEQRVGRSGIYLRFGAFTQGWLAFDDGVRPARHTSAGWERDDRRRGAGVSLPQDVRDWLDVLPVPEDPALPMTEPVLLQRSGAGAVYAARWQGEPAVVKTARAGAGVDLGGATATERHEHEERVLHRLAGTGLAPEVLDSVVTADSRVLVITRVPGVSLQRWVAQNHPPAAATEATIEAAASTYRRTCCSIVGQVREQLAAMHRLGVAHGDIAPQNVLVDGSDVRLIDFESAALDGQFVAEGIATPGFGDRTPSQHADDVAADAIERYLLNPVLPSLLGHPPIVDGGHELIVREGAADLLPGFRLRAGEPLLEADRLREALLRGIHACATPAAAERLFPGGVGAFAHPAAPLSVLHGAAGVIATLAALDQPVPGHWLDWLADQARGCAPIPGAGEGLHGVARVLAEAGRVDESLRLLRRLPSPTAAGGLGWSLGSTGIALCQLQIGQIADVPELVEAATTALRAPQASARPRPGLLRGNAGMALALLRAAELRDDADPSTAAQWRAQARELVAQEPRRAAPGGSMTLSPHGSLLLPSLGEGIAGWALASLRLGDEQLDPLVRQALSVPVCALGGLLKGRAGLLAGLAGWCDPDDVAVVRHRTRLAWTVAPLPGRSDVAVALSDANSKLSCDVATGSAGVLAALAGSEAVLRVLGLA
ncbi:protein kinase domain-containing protein [Flexivirga caeni]|uniref:Protein kinase domain-containing protein n=1 Tax=Flexivirga caeni TaxID=2294115 RepID=A0A3M9M6C7_9MICO|nr:hypothetical protein [Flexivirga caeni]RNI21111.1 hypothetical protein EFY87_12615 [Flexivirga caeni]